MSEILYRWGSSGLNDVLCCERYGYWSTTGGPPTFWSNLLTAAKKAAAIAKPADCRWELTNIEHGNFGAFNNVHMNVRGTFRVWDAANDWVEPWEVGFLHRTEATARADYEKRFHEQARLHSGMIDALIHYRETGEPTRDAWVPASAWYFRTESDRPDNRAYLRENEPGVICNETSENGFIHVTVEARGANRWSVECYAEQHAQGRRQVSERFEARSYDEGRKLGESWIKNEARPFIGQVERSAV